ncbi:MAG: sterol desaturase family protein [Planctomycetota bacterium]|nr:MAG: sterol desaturase family protein [Planctomycetota bacterium]
MPAHEKLIRALGGLLGGSLNQLFWYALLACGVWLFFSLVFRARFRHRRISRQEPTRRQVGRELLFSLRSIIVFGVVTGAVVYAACSGWTRLYVSIDDYGWGWFVLSIVVMIVVHDAYFYWTHRLMHHPRLYRAMHHAHHLSMSPTPWAAYAFSTAEAFVQAGIGPLIVFTMPVHPAAFGLFMVWQIAFNVFGHCGYEIYPHWFLKSRAGLLLNSVTHHAMHHEKFRSNYGLYFNVWDRLMGTNHPDYEQRFELATATSLRRSRKG